MFKEKLSQLLYYCFGELFPNDLYELKIEEAKAQIISLIADVLPKEKCYFKRDLPTSRYKEAKFIEQGFNQALKELKDKLGVK